MKNIDNCVCLRVAVFTCAEVIGAWRQHLSPLLFRKPESYLLQHFTYRGTYSKLSSKPLLRPLSWMAFYNRMLSFWYNQLPSAEWYCHTPAQRLRKRKYFPLPFLPSNNLELPLLETFHWDQQIHRLESNMIMHSFFCQHLPNETKCIAFYKNFNQVVEVLLWNVMLKV